MVATRRLYTFNVAGRPFQKVNLEGKVYIITGANTGIGLETARELILMGATVVMACRDTNRANKARDDVIASTKCAPSKVIVIKLDLCGFDSVKKFVKDFRSKGLPLHGLINNAGLIKNERQLTQDGFEIVFTANHLSHFMLTNLLLPDLEKVGGRIVVLTSSLHKNCEKFNSDDVMSEKKYEMFATYSQSKLANCLFVRELQRQLTKKNSKVTVNAVHPGLVRTEVTRHMSWFMQTGNTIAAPFMWTLQKTPKQGASCSIHVATSPKLEGKGGGYYFNSRKSPYGKAALDDEAARELWRISEKLTGLTHKENSSSPHQ